MDASVFMEIVHDRGAGYKWLIQNGAAKVERTAIPGVVSIKDFPGLC